MNAALALCSVSALLVPVLPAQAVRALPRQATDAFGGATTFSIPQASFRAQYWFAPDNLPAVHLLNAIGIRVARNTATLPTSRSIEITVASSPVTFTQLVPSFAQNFGASPVTFFASRTVNFTTQPPTGDPNLAGAWFPGDAPFVHVSNALVVDFKAGVGTTTTTVPNDGFVMGAGSLQTLHLAGRASCGGTLSANWNAGVLGYTASGLPAGVPVALDFGLDHVSLNGVPLPIDMTPYGFPNCWFGLAPIASANLLANASGVATLSLGVPLPSTWLSLSAQAIHPRVPNPQLPSDYGTTNVVTSTLGPTGLCNALFATPSTATVAQQGPQPVSNSIVLLVQ